MYKLDLSCCLVGGNSHQPALYGFKALEMDLLVNTYNLRSYGFAFPYSMHIAQGPKYLNSAKEKRENKYIMLQSTIWLEGSFS